MNERRACSSRACGAVRQSEPSLTVRAIAAFVLIVAPALQLPAQVDSLRRRSLPAVSQPLEGSGVTVWARNYQGLFIAGLDGALYTPYRPATIQRVQKSLAERGLYAGPMNGILDEPTMKSIYEFQEANNLQRCGIPTPNTRKILEQGSHTDLTFRSRVRRERNGTYLALRSRM